MFRSDAAKSLSDNLSWTSYGPSTVLSAAAESDDIPYKESDRTNEGLPVRGELVEGLSNAWESCESLVFNRTPGIHVSPDDGTVKSTVPFSCSSPGPAQTSA